MINYNKLFNVLYSDEISEEVKVRVIEKLGTELNESMEVCSPYVEYINTLINSNITEACLSDILDTTFGKLSEAEVEAIAEEFIKASVISYISEAGFKFYGDPRPIGLTGLKKEAAKQENKVVEPKKPSAMDKLKSAAGKVKAWASSLERQPNPVGLSKLQAKKEEQLKQSAEMGTQPKAPEAKTTMTPKAEEEPKAPEAKTSTSTTPKISREEKLAQLRSKYGRPNQEEQKENKNSAIYKSVLRHGNKLKKDQEKEEKSRRNSISAALDNAFSRLRSTEEPEGKEEKTEVKAVEEPKVETPTAEKKTTKRTTKKKTSTKTTNTVAKKVAKAVKPKKKATKKKTAKISRKPKNANEALADTLCLLADTNISESALTSIVEMMSNAKLAKKAVEKEEHDFNNAANALNNEVERSAKTGIPVNPQTLKKAEEQAERYERFKSLVDKKFGSEC